MENNNLAANSFKLIRKTYPNGISVKFDNRRVTTIKLDDGFGIEFRSIDYTPTPHVVCEHLRGKIAVTRLKLSKEATEIMIINLAEQMGFQICKTI